MLTRDTLRSGVSEDPIADLRQSAIPDTIECGETNEYWVRVHRSIRRVELESKITGSRITLHSVNVWGARLYRLPPLLLNAIQAALKL